LALPERYREVVVLCDLQEMSYAEAAEILGCAVGTVRSRLHRARALLTEKLRPVKDEEAAEVKSARCFA
jgi:RNA polymerase sigma-70 factor (ECF subfamily)